MRGLVGDAVGTGRYRCQPNMAGADAGKGPVRCSMCTGLTKFLKGLEMIARLDPAIFERELPVPALPVWEPLPETLGGAEERRWGLRDDGSLAAEYDGAQGRMVFASELTPAEQVSFLFSLVFLLFVLTSFQRERLANRSGTRTSIVEVDEPAAQDTIETVPTVDRAESVSMDGSRPGSSSRRVPEEVRGPVVESQDTIGPGGAPRYLVPGGDDDGPALELGPLDDEERMSVRGEGDAGEDAPPPYQETELQRERRLADAYEEEERARMRAQLEEALEAQRRHREDTERLRARRLRAERAEERRRQREEAVEAEDPSWVPVTVPEVESQDTIETVPAPVPVADDLQDLPCEDSVNERTGRLRYGIPAPTPNPSSCERCAARRIRCKGHPGRGCFYCIAVWRCACSLATQGRAKRVRGSEDDAPSGARQAKKAKKAKKNTVHGTEEARLPPVSQRQQQQQHQGLPAIASERPGRVPRVPRTVAEGIPGPSRFPGSFEDAREALSDHESEDEADRALAHIARDVRQLRRWGAAVVGFADELAAQLAALRSGLREREGEGKGKGKQRE